MKKKTDFFLVLFVVFGIGALVSNYTLGGPDQEKLARSVIIR